MAKTSPEESVMRYFETQPIEKAEVMLSIAKSIVKKRFSAPLDTNQKTYLDPHVANLKKKGQKIKKAHISEVGDYPIPQLAPYAPGSFDTMYANAVQATGLADITLKSIQENMDALGIKKHPLHGVYAPVENPGVDQALIEKMAGTAFEASLKQKQAELEQKEVKAKGKKKDPEDLPF